MTTGSVLWLILFSLAALLFFGIALVVAIRGVSDVRDLLRSPEDEEEPAKTPAPKR
ncbi:MAG TPA: hypothetical protein VMH23_15670 [Bacteroidota bacterium]|nr:hypothetical protein [Bacteroidota bacterium]